MIKNYLKIGIRNILKYKAFSCINVFGLAVAMSVSMLIILMLINQKSYDQFHERKDSIYRVNIDPANHKRPYASGPAPLAETLRTDYPIIKEATHLLKGCGGDAVYNNSFSEMRGYFTDNAFFRIFSFELEKGDRATALTKPNTMVLSHEVAQRLFGDEDPLGKIVDFADRGIDLFTDEAKAPTDWGTYTVTGVLADKDYKTHLEFDVLVSTASLKQLYQEGKMYDASENWGDYSRCYTYVLAENNVDEKELNSALANLADEKYKGDANLEGSKFMVQALTKLTPGPVLGNDPSSNLPMFAYYILAGFALLVMVLAVLNYTQLSIARAVTRSKEIGIRKVNGAFRKDLIVQFLSESMVLVFFALITAGFFLVFMRWALLNLWMNQFLGFELVPNATVYISFISFTFLTGLIAGIFPALRLSGYRPVKILKGPDETKRGRLGMRKTLTVTQFVFSLFFIVTAIVVYNQFRYYMDYEYGFNAENIINVNLQSNDYKLVKGAFHSVPGVSGIAGTAYYPGTGRNDNTTLTKPGTEEPIEAIDLRADENFIELLDIGLIAGRNLPASESSSFVVVNETTAQTFGYENPGDIVGELFYERNGDKTVEVVGVVEDFTFFLLFSSKKTGPIVLRNEPERFNFVSLKMASADQDQLIAQLEEAWKTVDPIHPLKYEFYEHKLEGYNQAVFDLVAVIGFFAFLTITIACLGLLGMAIYTMERRTKEIGIRKVLGAHGYMLVYLLSKEFLILLGIAVIIAAPLSYYVNNLWLDFLVIKVSFGFGTVLLGSFLILLLGFLTIAPQTLRVSNRNPITSLRIE
ncbi:ABC transporter permease [Ulvibacterium sp.]|uniref:ABC transporter permease n=1 Tax=Ulvibacterium sp. TaxID=2665914 RepID=UPI003BAA73CA